MHSLLLLFLIPSTLSSVHVLVRVEGLLHCPIQDDFTAIIRFMEEDFMFHDFGIQYTLMATESNVLSDGTLEREVEPFLQIIHNCATEEEKHRDEEFYPSFCVEMPHVSADNSTFSVGNLDLTSTLSEIASGAVQRDCSRYGALVYASRGGKLVLLSNSIPNS